MVVYDSKVTGAAQHAHNVGSVGVHRRISVCLDCLVLSSQTVAGPGPWSVLDLSSPCSAQAPDFSAPSPDNISTSVLFVSLSHQPSQFRRTSSTHSSRRLNPNSTHSRQLPAKTSDVEVQPHQCHRVVRKAESTLRSN